MKYRVIILVSIIIFLFGCDSMMGTLPIHNVVSDGNLGKVREMLRKEPSLINAQSDLGVTPLYIAAMDGHKDIVEFLLDNGADIELGNHLNERPLAKAVKFNHYDIALMLIEHGAIVNVQDEMGQTPLHEAISRGSIKLVTLLVSHGANMFLKNSRGETPRDKALEIIRVEPESTQYEEIVQYLEIKEIETKEKFKDSESVNQGVVSKEWRERCVDSYYPDCEY